MPQLSDTIDNQKLVVDTIVLDLETTGLLEHEDHIVEFGVIGVTADLQEVFRIQELIQPNAETVRRIRENPFVLEMCEANGLLDELDAAVDIPTYPDVAAVEQQIIAAIDAHGGAAKIVLGGSGVATFDLRWIKLHMPTLAARLQYWTADVGVVRRSWREGTGDDLIDINGEKDHRALADAEKHLEEMRAFREVQTLIKELAGGGTLEQVRTALLAAIVTRNEDPSRFELIGTIAGVSGVESFAAGVR